MADLQPAARRQHVLQPRALAHDLVGRRGPVVAVVGADAGLREDGALGAVHRLQVLGDAEGGGRTEEQDRERTLQYVSPRRATARIRATRSLGLSGPARLGVANLICASVRSNPRSRRRSSPSRTRPSKPTDRAALLRKSCTLPHFPSHGPQRARPGGVMYRACRGFWAAAPPDGLRRNMALHLVTGGAGFIGSSIAESASLQRRARARSRRLLERAAREPRRPPRAPRSRRGERGRPCHGREGNGRGGDGIPRGGDPERGAVRREPAGDACSPARKARPSSSIRRGTRGCAASSSRRAPRLTATRRRCRRSRPWRRTRSRRMPRASWQASTCMRIFAHLYGIETVSLRYFNVFGPRQDPKSDYAAVIPKFITAAIRKQRCDRLRRRRANSRFLSHRQRGAGEPARSHDPAQASRRDRERRVRRAHLAQSAPPTHRRARRNANRARLPSRPRAETCATRSPTSGSLATFSGTSPPSTCARVSSERSRRSSASPGDRTRQGRARRSSEVRGERVRLSGGFEGGAVGWRRWAALLGAAALLRAFVAFVLLGSMPMVSDAHDYFELALRFVAGDVARAILLAAGGEPCAAGGVRDARTVDRRRPGGHHRHEHGDRGFVVLIGRELGGRPGGPRLAGGWRLVYAPGVLLCGQTYAQHLAALCLAAMAYFGLRAGREPRLAHFATAGLALGAGILTRPSMASVAPVVATAWAIAAYREPSARRAVGAGAVAAACVALACILPVCAHDARTGAGWTVSTNNERNLFLGNNPFTPDYKTSHLGQRALGELDPDARTYLESFYARRDKRVAMQHAAVVYMSNIPHAPRFGPSIGPRPFGDSTTWRRAKSRSGAAGPARNAPLLALEAGSYLAVAALALVTLFCEARAVRRTSSGMAAVARRARPRIRTSLCDRLLGGHLPLPGGPAAHSSRRRRGRDRPARGSTSGGVAEPGSRSSRSLSSKHNTAITP